MTANRHVPALLLGFTLLCFLLGGCTPKPKPPHYDDQPAAAVPPVSRFGEFNLHRRHGLGDWQGQAMPSERELTRRLKAHPTGRID